MQELSTRDLLLRMEDLEFRLAEAEQLIDAIKAGEVDAFALNKGNQAEIFTLQSGDYAYRVLVENFNEGALNLSEDGLIVYTNNYFNKLLTLPYEKVIGTSFFQFVHPASKETFNELFKKGLSGQSKGEINLVVGNTIFPVYVSLTSLYPTLPTVGMIVSDLSEKKAHERILKHSEEKFNKLFGASPFGLVLTEIPLGEIIDANEIYFEMIGYTRQECIGRTFIDLKLIDNTSYQELLDELLKNGYVKNIESEITKQNGEHIPVLNSIEKITIGEKDYYLSAIVDITERKNDERKIKDKNVELQKINKELEAFTYISSHDLQEPLRKIQTFAGRIIDQEVQLSGTGKEYLSRMQDAAARMQTLIQDLLSFSRLATAERKFEISDFNEIIDEVKIDLKELILEKKCTIQVTELCKINIIPFQFRQLVQNLISNSLKFSKPDVSPHIVIKGVISSGRKLNNEKLLPEKNYCHISFSDNGIGFEERFSEKIFEVFQKLHGKDEFAGTGIGLAIVKKIVENHNGVISAQSELNKGATFDIYLPA